MFKWYRTHWCDPHQSIVSKRKIRRIARENILGIDIVVRGKGYHFSVNQDMDLKRLTAVLKDDSKPDMHVATEGDDLDELVYMATDATELILDVLQEAEKGYKKE